MSAPPTAAEKRSPSTRYVEELHEFFASHRLPFGSPEDVVGLAERLSTPGLFEEEMGSMVRSIILREGGNPALADLLGIVAVAIGGPQMEERASEFTEPIHKVVKFLASSFRMRWGSIPPELTHEERAAAANAAAVQTLAPVAAEPIAQTPQENATPAYAIHPGRGISAAHAFSAARDISRAHVEPETQPEAGLEPLIVPAAAKAAEHGVEKAAVDTEPKPGLEPLPQPVSEIAAQIVADAVIRPEPVVEAVVVTPVAAAVPKLPAEAQVRLEPLPQKTAAAKPARIPAKAEPQTLRAAKGADDEDRPDLHLPRFLRLAVAEHEEFEGRPWIRRQAGWIAAACVTAAALGAGAWAYRRVVAQDAWVKEHTHPVTAPAVVAAPAPAPPPAAQQTVQPAVEQQALPAKPRNTAAGAAGTHRYAGTGYPGTHRTYTGFPRTARPVPVDLGNPTAPAAGGQTTPRQQAAPVYRVSPPVPYQGTQAAPASPNRPPPPQM